MKLIEQHQQLVAHAKLFICGTGTAGTNASLMSRHFDEQGWKLPDKAVGELAFNLLNSQGARVDVPGKALRFMQQLNPKLNLTTVMHIAGKERVVIVLDAEEPLQKAAIGRAVLLRRYATGVVLGTRLATEIINTWRAPS